MLYEALKISEKWQLSADVKSNIEQQEIKDLMVAPYKFL